MTEMDEENSLESSVDSHEANESLSLETQLAEAIKELDDLKHLNYDLSQENQRKDQLIAKNNELSTIIYEKNDAELEQMHLEDHCYFDEISFEIHLEQTKLNNLKLEVEKLKTLESENKNIERSIEVSSTRLSEQSLAYANNMHTINKKMRNYREEVEITLRKELTRIDRVYQEKAFQNLNHEKKSTMLQLAMLQDEMTLQNVGKSNLQARLQAQDRTYVEYNEESKRLKKHVSVACPSGQKYLTTTLYLKNVFIDFMIWYIPYHLRLFLIISPTLALFSNEYNAIRLEK